MPILPVLPKEDNQILEETKPLEENLQPLSNTEQLEQVEIIENVVKKPLSDKQKEHFENIVNTNSKFETELRKFKHKHMDWTQREYTKKQLEQMKVYKFSYSKKLIKEKRINEEFMAQISNLTLEEIIGLKLEISAGSFNNKLYGLPLWSSAANIMRDALLKAAFTLARTKLEAACLLGMTKLQLKEYSSKFGMNVILEEPFFVQQMLGKNAWNKRRK